jgi:segregation and condensation protein B
MEISQIIPHIEALIFASDKPLTAPEITELVNNALGFIEDRASEEQVLSAIEGIHEKYDSEFYAFELKQSGGGWQFLTKPAYHKTVALINGDKFIKKLSIASLETLAIIAYKQPITKSEIESIRGVNCDYAVQKLLEKDLVIISGRNEDAVGKPLIYATSKSFMDYFGINSADELPKINEVLMEEFIRSTGVSDEGIGRNEEEEINILTPQSENEQEEMVDENVEIEREGESITEVENSFVSDEEQTEEIDEITEVKIENKEGGNNIESAEEQPEESILAETPAENEQIENEEEDNIVSSKEKPEGL